VIETVPVSKASALSDQAPFILAVISAKTAEIGGDGCAGSEGPVRLFHPEKEKMDMTLTKEARHLGIDMPASPGH
jgi:hypothetical protein